MDWKKATLNQPIGSLVQYYRYGDHGNGEIPCPAIVTLNQGGVLELHLIHDGERKKMSGVHHVNSERVKEGAKKSKGLWAFPGHYESWRDEHDKNLSARTAEVQGSRSLPGSGPAAPHVPSTPPTPNDDEHFILDKWNQTTGCASLDDQAAIVAQVCPQMPNVSPALVLGVVRRFADTEYVRSREYLDEVEAT